MGQDNISSKKGMDLANDIAKIMQDDELRTKLEDYPTFKDVVENNQYSKELITKLSDKNYLTESIANFNNEEREASLSKFSERIEFKMKRKIRTRLVFKYAASCAAAALLFSFLIYNIVSRPQSGAIFITSKEKPTISVPTLIYDDEIAINILNKDIDKVVANLKETSKTQPQEKKEGVKYNTVVVPKQFTYTVKLPDSSLVTLNANSELRYPQSFDGEERRIYLKGEAFFTVSKSGIPFIVSTEKGDIKVYGTKFNVNLNRSSTLQVLLVNGSVGVTIGDISLEIMLSPKDLLEYNDTRGTNVIKNVNIEDYISWMDGGFKYNKIGLHDLLEELSSWYGVQFEYRSSVNNIPITINVSREIELNKLLNILETMTNVKFIKEKGGLYSVN